MGPSGLACFMPLDAAVSAFFAKGGEKCNEIAAS
jgi:hypothetical protein